MQRLKSLLASNGLRFLVCKADREKREANSVPLTALGAIGLLLLMAAGGAQAQTTQQVDPSVTAFDNLFKTLPPEQKTVYIADQGFKVDELKAWRNHLAGGRTTQGTFDWGDNLTWPNHRVPYIFDGNMSDSYRKMVTDAIFEWQKVANVVWAPRLNSDADYVRFFFNGSSGMNSFVGRLGAGEQTINIDTSANLIRCAHEVGHCMGFVHEQCRPDRDTYVTVVSTSGSNNALTNINWAKLPSNKASTYGTYDYDSLMHYPANGSVSTSSGTFSATITPKEPYYTYAGKPELGQEDHLSTLDKASLASQYGPACSISGRVKTGSGKGIAGLTITCTGTNNSVYFGPTVTTDANGNYTLLGTSTGTYSVTLSGGAVIPVSSAVTIGTTSATGVDFSINDSNRPTISISSPANGSTATYVTSASGVADDELGVDYVGVLLKNNADGKWWVWSSGTWGTTTYDRSQNFKTIDNASNSTHFNWSTSLPNLGTGSYNIQAISVDVNDNDSGAYASLSYSIDSSGPYVFVGSPGDGTSVTTLSSISGTATDSNGIAQNIVNFTLFHDGQYWNGTAWQSTQATIVANVSGNTWSTTLVPTGGKLGAGTYYISASARDTQGNLSTPQSGVNQTSFVVDNTPPTCSISSPINGTTLSSLSSISGKADDDKGLDVASMSLDIERLSDHKFWDNNHWGDGSATVPLTYDASSKTWQNSGPLPVGQDANSGWVSGAYHIFFIAHDKAGNTTQADCTVTLINTFTWTGATLRDNTSANDSNNWDTAANWLPYGVPGAGDNALITNGDTVQADGSHSVLGLTLTGSTLNTTGLLVKTLDLNGTLNGGAVNSNGGVWNWSGGTISGTWSVFSGATFNISGDTQKDLNANGVINNAGTITFSGAGPLRGLGNSTINNQSGGTFILKNSSAVFNNYNGNNKFNNLVGATLKKQNDVADANSVSTINAWALNNSGTIGAINGVLELTTGEGVNFASGSTITGSGRTRLAAGTLTTTGTATIKSTTFDMTGGYLNGTGALATANASTFNWSGGNIKGLSIGAGTNFNISGTGGKDIDAGGVINSSGHTTLSGTGYLRGLGNSTFNNLSGGVFTIVSDAPFTNYNGGNVFNNAAGAIVEKTVGTATTSNLVDWAFNNSGLTRASQGVLSLNAGGSDAGTFSSIGAGIVRFTNGVHTLKTGTLFNGTGKGQLVGGTLAVTGNAVIGSTTAATTFEISGGATSGTSTSNFTSYGTVNWTGGTIGGKFTVAPKANLILSGPNLKDIGGSSVINNSGITIWKGTGVMRGLGTSTFNNLSGGVFDVQNNGPLFGDYNGNNVFNQSVGATFKKSVGTGVSGLNTWTTNINGGTITVGVGTLQSQSALNILGNTAVNGAGIFQLSGSSTLKSVLTSAAHIVLDGSLSCFKPTTGTAPSHYAGVGLFDWKAGVIGGPVTFDAGTKVNLSGDALKDIGTGGVINNLGTFKWLGKGALRGLGTSTFNNLSGGTFDIAVDGGVFAYYNGDNTFNNNPGATLKKSAGAGTSGMGAWTFNLKGGPVVVAAGTLQSQSLLNISAVTAVSGAGKLQLSSQTNLSSTLNSASPVGLDGSLTGTTAARYMGAGLFTWTGGSINGTFALNTGSKMNLSGAALKDLSTSAVFNNSGTVSWLGGGKLRGIGTSTFNNLSGGVFDLLADGAVLDNYNGGNVFNNQVGGTLRKSGGSGVSNVGAWTFNQSGAILANVGIATTSGGALEFNADLNLNGGTVGGARFTRFNGGVLKVTGTPTIASTTFEIVAGSTSGTGSVATTGTGVLKWTNGTINQLTTAKGATLLIAGANQRDINAGGVLTNNGIATWTGGNIRGIGNSVINNAAGATFTDTSKASLVDYNGGNLFKNAGTLKTGATVGKTTMSWSFQQLSTGILPLDVVSAAATGFDQYSVGGGAALAGTLQIVRPSSFLPALGTTFKFLTSGGARTAQFGTAQNLAIDATRQFQVIYNTNDVTLKVVAKAASPKQAAAPAPTATPEATPPPVPTPTEEPTPTPVPSAAKLPSASVSSAAVSVSNSSVQLAFANSLDSVSASDLTHYSVTVNGHPVELQGVSVRGGSITLLLPEGSLHAGDSVQVAWSGLQSGAHHLFSPGVWNNLQNPT